MEPRGLRIGLRIWVIAVLLFLYVPIALIILYAFNRPVVESWPISSLTLHWFSVAWHDSDVRNAFLLSVKVALLATAIALALGSAVAYAVHHFQFFGRDAISFLLVLPLALPGVVTGVALSSFFAFNSVQLSIWTIVIGHATFCVVVVYNNMIARLRRVAGRGLHGPGRARVADAALHHPADGGDGAGVRRPARVRALLRRGHRDRVHRRCAEHPAAVDLRRHPARPATARGERGGVHRHRPDRHSRGAGRKAVRGGCRHPVSGGSCSGQPGRRLDL